MRYSIESVAQDATADARFGRIMGDLQTSAWFMPFNLNPPEVGGEGDKFGSGLGGFGGGGI